jgi:glycosyltransferase involved in cell wall biosynthesis
MKEILLITYYFPPCGGAAVQRWVRFLPLLAEAGYDITVLTTKDGDYPDVDKSLLSNIPPQIKVIRTFTPIFGKLWKSLIGKESNVPYGSFEFHEKTSFIEKIVLWFRLNCVIPDARIVWNFYAKRRGARICSKKNFAWVITTGPPHSTHLIGMYLKKRFKLNWIADFRDPWTQIFYLKDKRQNYFIRAINENLEKRVLSKADKTLVVSDYIMKQLPNGNKLVLYNGYDKNDFSSFTYQRSDEFRLKYVGQLTEGQDIDKLLEFLSSKTSKDFVSNSVIQFIGTRNIVMDKYSIPIRKVGFIPHRQATQEMINCELLLLMINKYNDNQGMVTTKLFEYIASRTPILCLGPLHGEAASIINQAGAGFVSDSLNEDVIVYINKIYQSWEQNQPIRNDNDIIKWSVQQQIGELICVLD